MTCILTEVPSFQRVLATSFPAEKFTILGINSSSSRSWLQLYRGQWGISFPFVYDDGGKLFALYQVGAAFGNIPPTYVVIDAEGKVRFRTDDRFNQTEDLRKLIGELLPR